MRGEGKWNAREEKWIISAHDTRQEKFSPPRRGGETRAVEFPRLKFSIRNGIKYLNGWFTREARGGRSTISVIAIAGTNCDRGSYALAVLLNRDLKFAILTRLGQIIIN